VVAPRAATGNNAPDIVANTIHLGVSEPQSGSNINSDTTRMNDAPNLLVPNDAGSVWKEQRPPNGEISPTALRDEASDGRLDVDETESWDGILQGDWPPGSIHPLPDTLKPRDIAYLRDKQALHLVPLVFRDACLARYTEFFHPVMPVLNLNSFLEDLKNDNGKQGVSLLLVTAVLYAGSAFVEMGHIRNAGYASRLAARQALYLQGRVSTVFNILRVTCDTYTQGSCFSTCAPRTARS